MFFFPTAMDIGAIEAEMARTQKNKATNAHLGLLKAGSQIHSQSQTHTSRNDTVWNTSKHQYGICILLHRTMFSYRYAGIWRTSVDQAKLAKLRATIVSEGTRGSGGGGGQQGFEALVAKLLVNSYAGMTMIPMVDVV